MTTTRVRGASLMDVALVALVALVMLLAGSSPTAAQKLGSNCTASIMNRTVQVNANGTFAIPDVPVDQGSYRVRIVCKEDDGTVTTFISGFQTLVPNGHNAIGKLTFDPNQPIPVRIEVIALTSFLTSRGQTEQLSVRGTLPNGTARDLTGASTGTFYATSNARIATVSSEGLVTAVGPGQVIISARNEGVLGSAVVTVSVPNDADLDGATDEWERANGLNPNDPNDASQDADNDGLTNLQEFKLGTNPRAADTDGDGLSDGDEVTRGTNPLVADSDGDGLSDGQEVKLGTSPLNADTDADRIPDGIEVQLGLDPRVATATTTVVGRVVDGTGSPVSQASVLAFSLFTAQTDQTGGFSIVDVPATLGDIVVLARIVRNNQLLDGTSIATTPSAGGTTDVRTIQVSASAGVVTGLITDPSNRAVAGAAVTLTMGLDRRSTTTDATGRYRIGNVQPGSVVLTANDPRTFLRGRISAVVVQDQPLTLNLRLGAFGSIGGTVFQRDGSTPVGAGVNVALSGAMIATASTDPLGRYIFDFVPLAAFNAEATDSAGNRGRTSGSLTVTGQTAAADVAFLARGNVVGTVKDGANTPVANATVTFSDGSVFGGSRTVTTDALGRYSFFDVFIGAARVTASSPLTGLGGQGSGTLQSDGQTITIDITLAATGTLTGTVFRAGTSPSPLAGARVQLSNGRVTTADALGRYQFTFVPTGGLSITALDIATGDRGDTSATINANQTTTANVTLNGQAPVVVIVRNGANDLVAGAQVTVHAAFGSTQQSVTAADGSISFPRVFVGGYNVSAFNPATQLSGTASGTAVLGATTTTTVRLRASGTITGVVLGSNGTTPVANVRVQLSGAVFRNTTSSALGAFRFDIVPTGTYTLDAIDQFGNLRARVSGMVLDTEAQQITRNLQMVGIGTVSGVVTNPDAAPVPNVAVFLKGPRSAQALTDTLGRYSVPGVPIGSFSVSASVRSGSLQLFGSTQGQITADGQAVQADINLSANLVPTVTTLHDANNFEYNLRENGSLQDGTRQFFLGDGASNRGGALLDVIVGSTTTRFDGQSLGTSSNQGRQIGIAQVIGPLNVTRKIYVPLTGYFARYLEAFTNTSDQPVTFGVRLTSFSRYISKVQNGFRFNREPRVVSTSSGDATLDAGVNGDHWVVFDDDEDFDPFVTNSLPSVAHVFDGPSAPSPAAAASFALQPAYGQFTNEWNNLTLQPGETLALMHLVSEETLRSAAQAAATRLVQVPPEAIVDGTLPDLLTSVQRLKALTDLLSTQAQDLLLAFGGAPNTFANTASAVSTLAGNVNALLAGVQSLAGETEPTASELRTAATSASDLANQVRLAALDVPATQYCSLNQPVGAPCPTIKNLADASPAGHEANFANTASSTATGAVALQTTASNLQELMLVRNFVLPLAGGSTLAPLPALTGRVFGQVLAGDGHTTLPGTQVSFHSDHPLFTRTFTVNANGSGQFSFESNIREGSSAPIPMDAYSLRGTHPQTLLRSPTASGTFDEGTTGATTDIVFTNSGQLTGIVRRASGAVASGGTVQLTGGGFGTAGLANSLTVAIGVDGGFGATGLPGGTYNLVVTLPEPQGTPLTTTGLAVIADGETRNQDLLVAATGGVSGLVRRTTGAVAPGIPVTLRTSTLTRSTSTDTAGRYTFFDVFTESARVDAVDRATNTAATGIVTVAPDVVTPLDLSLTVGGTVTGVIRSGNQPVAGAQVTVTWTDGGTIVQSGSDGSYSVDHVTPGPVRVRAQNANGLGANAGTLGISGETLTLNVTLFAGGTVSGTVFRAATNPPAPVSGVEVSINRFVAGLPSTVTTDALGRFAFEAVPVGTFTMTAADPATGDRGSATNQVNANGDQRTVNITLIGQGRVTVTVRDASENLINHARVIVYSQTQFGGNQAGDTAPDGTVVFDRVLAGPFFLSATDPATQLAGSTTDSVTAGGSRDVTVRLQPAATILGRVFGPDGTTPEGGTPVRILTYYFGVQRQTTTAIDGTYRFDAVPLGTYTVEALDANNRLRARASNVELSTNGQIVTRNLTFLGFGTVTGIVSNPNGSAASSVGVTVQSTSPIGGFFNATTDSTGAYRVSNVPAGAFIARAQTQQLIGETNGLISQDGQQVVANIQLANNAINLPVYRYDGNNFYVNLRGDGSIGDATSSVYGGDFGSNFGAFLLDIFRQGTPARFTGGTIGTTEENGQEIAVRQQGVAGLDITRKMFLPRGGYFTRFLEILTNPTADPITVDVRVQNNLRPFYAAPRVITTSSGDAALSVGDPNDPDRWVVTGDVYDFDPYVNGGVPETAFVFDGPNAAERAGAASFQQDGSYSLGQLAYRWNNVTIPAGGTVAYMHFGVQETSRAAAQAAAQRLVQLPPEALTGLNASEISEIRNFAVPVNGVSALDPIALGGTITGRAFEFDGTTPVTGMSVRIQSNNPIYSRVYFASTNANGAFSLASQTPCLGCSGNVSIPIEPFTVFGSHPQTGTESGHVSGSFNAGQTVAVRNIVFTGTSVVSGVVRFTSGAATTNSGYVQLVRSTPSSLFLFASLANDGTYRLGGVPPGAYTAYVTAYHPQGTALQTTRTLTVAADRNVNGDVTLPQTGHVSGVVRTAGGAAVPNMYVYLHNGSLPLCRSASICRSAFTNASGAFLLSNVPVGTYSMEVYDSNLGVVGSAIVQVTITDNQTTARDLTMFAVGTLQIQVNFAAGSVAPNSRVTLAEAARGSDFRHIGYTDSSGRVTATNVAAGNFTVRAYHPGNGALFSDVTGNLPNAGDTLTVTVALPATGVITGVVTRADGTTTVRDSFVEVRDPVNNQQLAWMYTDANGRYTFTQLPAGRPLTMRAYNPNGSGLNRELLNQTIPSDGATLTVNFALPALATVRVTVLKSDGTPFPNTRIDMRTAFGNFYQFRGFTGSDGTLSIANVPEGIFSILARDPNTFASRGSATREITQANDNQTVDVTINAPLSGNVTGTVFAADNETGLGRYAFVEALDTASGDRLNYAYTDEEGRYTINGIVPGGAGFTIRAHSPNDFTIVGEATGAFTVTGETKTVNITVPVSVLRGRVTFTDGTPVPYPDVFATETPEAAERRTFYSYNTRQDGTYRLFGLPAGVDFVVTAQDNYWGGSRSGLTGTATARIESIATPATVDVTLAPSGTIEGVVRNAAGPVPFADVALSGSGQSFDRFVSADENGFYQFRRVALGSVVVQGCDFSIGGGVCGTGSAAITTDNETQVVNITVSESGGVQGTVTDGGNPVANSRVTVESLSSLGPYSPIEQSIYTDSAGRYAFVDVPAGAVRVNARDPNNFNRAGVTSGTVTAGETATIDVALGNAVRFGVLNLDGSDGFRYDVDCDGSLGDGGRVDRTLYNAYNGAYYLTDTMQNNFYSCLSVGLLDQNGRQVTIGPASLFGMNVTRKIFSPEGGGFARYLEIIQNPTSTEQNVTFQATSYLGYSSGIHVVVAPSATNNQYAVTDNSGTCCNPALAHVFGGPYAAVNVSATQFVDNDDTMFYRWNLTVPANGTIVLMHFAVQRGMTDAAGAETQAQALVSLSDPNALAGMTATERSQVVNFYVPPQ
ncbi:MAG TPA: carboxypeptidase regulatory-like domain-containing protein [Vicinamibacterales bacterium]|nr:carboxypeptidase regulatory-like domain-containing protein [Vicinamibacterales bacterium]